MKEGETRTGRGILAAVIIVSVCGLLVYVGEEANTKWQAEAKARAEKRAKEAHPNFQKKEAVKHVAYARELTESEERRTGKLSRPLQTRSPGSGRVQ